jgi:ribose transport system substrate-binding protein
MNIRKTMIGLAAAASLAGVGGALADHFDDGQYPAFEKAMKGKTVAFVPISMGFDLPQAWAAGLQHDADKYGYKLVIRDPNWDVAAGAQALTQLIAEKPDVLIFHPLDMTAYSKLVKKAGDAGIATIQVNLKSLNTGDAYIGADWYDLLATETEAMAKICGAGSGQSGKIALLEGNPTTPTVIIGMQGVNDSLAKHPELKVVATQSADWDATKAHDITSTILKQNEDLCGIIGFWDGQDVGTAAAIKEAGKTGKVHLISEGGGRQAAACDNVANGNFDAYVSHDAKGQARDLEMTVRMLLQNKPEKGGAHPFALYTPLKTITKDNLSPSSCWTIEDIKANGG